MSDQYHGVFLRGKFEAQQFYLVLFYQFSISVEDTILFVSHFLGAYGVFTSDLMTVDKSSLAVQPLPGKETVCPRIMVQPIVVPISYVERVG